MTIPDSVYEAAVSYAYEEDREAVVVKDVYHDFIVIDAEHPNARGGIAFDSSWSIGCKEFDVDADRIFDGIREILDSDPDVDVYEYCANAFTNGWNCMDDSLKAELVEKVAAELERHRTARGVWAQDAVVHEYRCDGFEHVFNGPIMDAAKLAGYSRKDAYIGIGMCGSLEASTDTWTFAGRPTVTVDRDGEMFGDVAVFSNIASMAAGEPMAVTVEDGEFVIQAAEG